MGTLYEQFIAATSRTDQQAIVAQAIRSLGSLTGQSWTRGLITVTIVDGPSVDILRRVVSVRVQVMRNGKDITPVDLNPLEYTPIHRFPLLVPDDAGDVTQGNRRFRDDLRTAFLLTVRDTLRGVMGG